MHRFFGTSKPQEPKPTLSDATKRVDERVGVLDEKIKKLDTELIRLRDQIKKTRAGPAQNGLKQRAMKLLQQKKMYESQRDQLWGQSFNMEQTTLTQQSLQDTVITVAAMKDAQKSLSKQMKTIKINEIENMQDDMEDLLELNNEIQETLGRNYAIGQMDESELEDELDMLMDSELDGLSELDLISAPSHVTTETNTPPPYLMNTPSVPTTQPVLFHTPQTLPVTK